jgi:hypothetical protein
LPTANIFILVWFGTLAAPIDSETKHRFHEQGGSHCLRGDVEAMADKLPLERKTSEPRCLDIIEILEFAGGAYIRDGVVSGVVPPEPFLN